jgi:hypothetical protein
MARLILPYQSVFDLNGHPLPGAKMYFYESGTVTPKDTYSDEALTTPNTNPVIADSQGQFGDIFLSGAYSCKLDDADDVTQPDYPAEIAATVDSTSSVLLTGAQTVAGVKTFTDRMANKSNTPTYELEENDGPANNRIYQMVAAAEQFILRLGNDARDSFAAFMTVDRTANTIDKIDMTATTVDFTATNLQHNGVPLTSAVLATKVLDIGSWNMDTTVSVAVAHGLTTSDIRSIVVTIRSDTGDVFDGVYEGSANNKNGTFTGADATNISISRNGTEVFDSANFDLTQNTIDNAAAVDKGDGTIGIPITANDFNAKDVTTIAGTVNYDGTYTIVSQTTNEIVITASYVAETFAGTETASWSRGWVVIGYAV